MSHHGYVDPDGYTSRDDPCPCEAAGLVECWCGGVLTLDDAREWLEGHDLNAETMDAVDVILAVEVMHPDGIAGLYDEVAKRKKVAR